MTVHILHRLKVQIHLCAHGRMSCASEIFFFSTFAFFSEIRWLQARAELKRDLWLAEIFLSKFLCPIRPARSTRACASVFSYSVFHITFSYSEGKKLQRRKDNECREKWGQSFPPRAHKSTWGTQQSVRTHIHTQPHTDTHTHSSNCTAGSRCSRNPNHGCTITAETFMRFAGGRVLQRWRERETRTRTNEGGKFR